VGIESLFVVSTELGSGSLFVSLGLMKILKKRYHKVAFFKPIITRDDYDIDTITQFFKLTQPKSKSYSLYIDEAEKILASEGEERLYEKILSDYERLKDDYDFVLCLGLNSSLLTEILQKDLNIEIAKNISTPIVGIVNGFGKSIEEIEEEIKIWLNSLQSVEVFAIFLNQVDSDTILCHTESIEERYDTICFTIAYSEELRQPVVMDIINATQANILHYGKDSKLQQTISGIKVAAMRAENFLEHLKDGDVVITPADRSDILLAVLSASHSDSFGTASMMIIGGEMEIADSIVKLYQNDTNFPIVIARSQEDTITISQKAMSAIADLTPKHTRKLNAILGHFDRFVDSSIIENSLKKSPKSITTPVMFLHKIFSQASKANKRIVLPESSDDRILQATEIILKRGIANITLLGDRDKIHKRAQHLGVDIKDAQIVNPNNPKLIEKFAQEFYKIRSHKGISIDEARDTMKSLSYFATMMVSQGLADAMVSGATHTTRETVRPALQIFGTKDGIDIVSSIFFICLDTRVLVYGDCAIVVNPDAKELAQIAISSAETASAFGIEPKVALLSYSSGNSGVGEEVEKVREATKLAQKLRPDIPIEGPLQYDAAIDESVARLKMPNSKVAGKANVFIFPDLNTGNNTYKAVQRSTSAIAIGPILQGLKSAVNDLSRGCTVDDIVSTVAITAIQAEQLAL